MKLKQTNNSKVRELLQQGPKSTEAICRAIPDMNSGEVFRSLQSLRRYKQITGNHALWTVEDWCSTEEKFQQSVLKKCVQGSSVRSGLARAQRVSPADLERQAAITRGVNMAILSWR